MSRADLRALAGDAKRPHLTRQAAREALLALDRVDIRLALDAGAPTHERAAGDDRVVILGPEPKPETATANHTVTAGASS